MLALCISGGQLQGLVYNDKVGKCKTNTRRLVQKEPEGVSLDTSLLKESKDREDGKQYLSSTNTIHCHNRYETQQENRGHHCLADTILKRKIEWLESSTRAEVEAILAIET